MKKRIEYFDVAKALLIALVVIGHELQYANPAYDIIPYTLAQEFIGSFYMPAFFCDLRAALRSEEPCGALMGRVRPAAHKDSRDPVFLL